LWQESAQRPFCRRVDGFSHPLAGKAILTGQPDGEGYVTSAKSTIDLLKRKVRFFSLDTLAAGAGRRSNHGKGQCSE
jgi:hypothetical protein